MTSAGCVSLRLLSRAVDRPAAMRPTAARGGRECSHRRRLSPPSNGPNVTLMEYAQWAASVHGVAYLAGDMAAPGCTGCHGDPAGGETRTVPFRLNIPARCGRCHVDQQVTAKYGLPNDTYESYLKTFHTPRLRTIAPPTLRPNAMRPSVATATPHAIHAPSDARLRFAPANPLRACVKCHQGAPLPRSRRRQTATSARIGWHRLCSTCWSWSTGLASR